MITKTLFLSAVLIFLLVISCKKQEIPYLPTGANTFSCSIDGQLFTPQLPAVILSTRVPLRAYRTGKSGFVVQAENSLNKLEIYVPATQGPGTYALGYSRAPIPYAPNQESYGAYTRYKPVGPTDDPYNPALPLRFYTTATYQGIITFTRLDTLARIAGGTFEYAAQEAATGQVAHVTKGQFDVRF